MYPRRLGWGDTGASDDDLPDRQRASSRLTHGGLSSASHHSGVFAEDIDDNEHQGQGNIMADQKILENAHFGVARLNLRSNKSTNRRTSRAANALALHTRIRRRSSNLANTWVGYIRHRPWRQQLAQVAVTLRLVDAIYTLVSVPLRLGFFFDPWDDPKRRHSWTLALSIFTAFDAVGLIVRFWFTKEELRPRIQHFFRQTVACCLRRVNPIDNPRLMSVLRASFVGDGDLQSYRSMMSGISSREDRVSAADTLPYRQRTRASHRMTATMFLSAVLNCFPFEIVLVSIPKNYNFLHIVGLPRYLQAFRVAPRAFSDAILVRFRHLPVIQALSFSSIASIVFLFIVGVYLIHLAGSGYMLVAHWECGVEFDKCHSNHRHPATWVQRDRLEGGILWRKYIRSMYWGSKTVTTLGQGDLVPATEYETAYRILVQFASGLWATAILTAYSFYFSRKDASMTTNLTTRLEQASRFLARRHVPTSLSRSVNTYFEYMQRTRFGVEEEMTLQALPSHYHTQCLNYVKYRSLQRLPLFKNREGAFLRSILASLEKDYYAPGQVVLNIGDTEEMFVVAKGEISVLDANNAVLGRLTPGNAYAESALFVDSITTLYKLVSEAHCEVWILHHIDFKAALKTHFSKLKYAGIMTSKAAKLDQHANRVSSTVTDMASAADKIRSHDHKSTNKMLRKMSTSDHLPDATKQKIHQAWRQPGSTFQRMWKHLKCALLLFQLYEVPYQIAFQRGYGLLNAEDYPQFGAIPRGFQHFDFAVSVLIESFFYVDWYFRARLFYRYVVGHGSGEDGNSSFGILKDRSSIFRHYRENENVLLDVIQNLPLPIVWDILPKNWFSYLTVCIARFVRLVRLIRLYHFRSLLRSLMIEHALPPSKRMIVYVIIFCTSTAHIAACTFFAVGDVATYRGGLPVGGVEPDSMTSFDCLHDATLNHNCTWYVYDRSTYNIDAPFLRALQWSVVLQSTVGFGEIMSFSSRECVVGCVWIFIGANICYYTGCVLSSVLGQLSIQTSIQRERMEVINLALINAPNVPEETKVMIRSYYDTKWETNGCAKRDQEILVHLPRSLRQRVREALQMEDLRACYLFAEDSGLAPSYFIRELTRIARSEIFLKNVMIVREGHKATQFFVIQKGEVELLLPPQSLAPPRSARGKLNSGEIKHKPNPLPSPRWVKADESNTLSVVERVSMVRNNVDALISLSRTSVRESIASSRLSVMYSRAMKLSAMDLVVPLRRRRASGESRPQRSADMVPIAILQRHDCFGEESITPSGQARTYQVNVRVVASAHVAVIERSDLIALAPRFPSEFQRIFTSLKRRTDQDAVCLRALQANFMFKEKTVRQLGIPKSLYVDRTKVLSAIDQANRFIRRFRVVDPEKPFARWWYRIVSTILVYNFYIIIFRVAFLPHPPPSTMTFLTAIDYFCDFLLYFDIFLKRGRLGYVEHGEKVMNPGSIRARYSKTWFKQDCWSMLPAFYHGDYFVMTLCRLPRLIRSPQLLLILDDAQTQILEKFLHGNNTKLSSVFDLFRFVLIFVSTAHYVGSLYYLLGRIQLERGIADRSWISVDFVIQQYPDNFWVHYMRAMYWCLSTFTVDCFGDILARNFLETIYSMSTCILGWIFIGQVIGRINMLMITLDKEANQHQLRTEDFDQYSKSRKLPYSLRVRAEQSLSFKTECLIPLRITSIFRDLPRPLRIQLFSEMYAPLIQPLREFRNLSHAQIEAVATALQMEIYLPGDIIYECGREGTTLYLMQHGCAEMFSPRANIVYAAVENGALFGECAFFIPGAKRLASTRAVRSCQVLQLHRRQWNQLWPQEIRIELEAGIVDVVATTYRDMARAFYSLTKNFYLKNDNAKAPRSISQRALFQLRRMQAKQQHITLIRKKSEPSQGSRITTPECNDTAGQERPSSAARRSGNPTRTPSPTVPNLDGAPVRPESSQSHSSSFKAIFKGEKRKVSLQRQSSSSSATGHGDEGIPRRPSSSLGTENQRRKSSLTAFAESVGLREPPKSRPTSGGGRLPPLSTVMSDRHLVRRESTRGGTLSKLSSATQLKWRRHEKRLSAIRMYRVAIKRVEEDIEEIDTDLLAVRRASIMVIPTVADSLQKKRAQLKNATAPRRFSIQVDRESLLNELLGFEGFENVDSGAKIDNLYDTDSWGDEDGDYDEEEQRPPTSADHSGSFTLTSFLTEITVGSRRSLRASRGHKIIPSNDVGNRGMSPNEVWVSARSGPAMFQEESRFRQVWDLIMLNVTVYYALVIPFRACFVHDHMDDPHYKLTVIATYALEYIFTDIPCLLDFVLRRHHFAFIENGETVSDRNRIAAHYWHEGTGPFDLVALLPLELVAISVLYLPGQSDLFSAGYFTPAGALPVWRTLAFARGNRLIRALFHLHPLSDRVQRFLLYDLRVSWLRPSLCYLIRLGLDFALGTHWISCLFFGISYLMHLEGHPSWLTTPGMLVFDDSCKSLEAVSHVPVLTKYLRAFHFSIGAVTTVCYGDILPMSALETIATILVIFVSVGLFSMLSGGFFKYFEMEFGKRADYEEKVRQVGQLMVFHQFPSRMWKQMQVYFALSWQESKGMHEEEMLRGLTQSMKNDIAVHVHANLLKHVKLLSSCEPPFARALLAVLKHELYVRNDVIIQRGDRGRSMYIIESGLVSIRRPEAKKQRPSATKQADFAFRSASAPKLWNSKQIIRDLKTAAQMAMASSSPATTKSIVPESPTEKEMIQAMQQVNQDKDGSPTLKVKVEPKPTLPRTTSGILAPDTGEAITTNRGAKEAPARLGMEGSVRGNDVRFVKGPFDYFGERSLLFGTPRMATCVALCVCSVYVLTLEQYERLLDEFPQYRRKNVQDWVLTGPIPNPDAAK